MNTRRPPNRPQSPLRNARKDAVYRTLVELRKTLADDPTLWGGDCGIFLTDLRDRMRVGRGEWTAAVVDRAIDDLVEEGRVQLDSSMGCTVIRILKMVQPGTT